MSISTIGLLARYDRGVNIEMGKVLVSMAPDFFQAPLTGYFPSIARILDHLYHSDIAWLGRFGTRRKFASLALPLLHNPPDAREPHFLNAEQFQRERTELDLVISKFVAELTEDDLASTLSYRNWKGDQKDHWFEGALTHFFNHHTHHRGMVAQALDQFGVSNDYSNLSRYLDE